MGDDEVVSPPPDRDDARDTRSMCLAMLGVLGLTAVAYALCFALYALMIALGLPVSLAAQIFLAGEDPCVRPFCDPIGSQRKRSEEEDAEKSFQRTFLSVSSSSLLFLCDPIFLSSSRPLQRSRSMTPRWFRPSGRPVN